MKTEIGKYIGDCYDKVAKRYICSKNKLIDLNSAVGYILLKFASYFKNNHVVYDLGCGHGYTTKFLKDNNVKIRGIDISRNMIREARKIYPDINFNYGNFFKLMLRDKTIDGIISYYSLVNYNLDSVKRAFNEFSRVLKDNGVFLFSFYVGSETIFVDEFYSEKIKMEFFFLKPEDVINLFKLNNFKVEEAIVTYPKDDNFLGKKAFIIGKKIK